MEKYIFMLGQSSDLAAEELKSLIGHIDQQGPDFIIAKTKQKPTKLINQLGGTIKIGRYLDTINDLSKITDAWQKILNKNQTKIHFGFSLYNGSQKNYLAINKLALAFKKQLKSDGYKCRLVSSREPVLSSVIVAKNKLINNELLIIKQDDQYILAQTQAVQDFLKYGLRDMKRPHRDDKSGMLPPKVAQMMINLAGANRDKNILDPFCGSGTVLQEAALLGFRTIYGTDINKKATSDTEDNLNWLSKEFDLKFKHEITKIDVKNINQHFKNKSIDLIVTEPFMGDARQISKIQKAKDLSPIKNELENLYKSAFAQFKKILSKDAKVVFIFPEFVLGNQYFSTFNEDIIASLGFENLLNKKLIYARPEQKIRRQITLWQLKN